MNYDYFNSFPPGYRFQPHDHELIVYYLKKKVLDETLPPNKINDVNLSEHNPETLTANFKQHGEKAWYFFTPRDRKYPNGNRPNRAAGDGYWKATSSDKSIMFNGHVVGYKKSLAFCLGKAPDGIKTPWIMQEYKLPADKRQESKRAGKGMKLDNWVLCKIYKHKSKSKDSVVHKVQAQQDHDAEHVPAEMNNVNNQNGESMPLNPMPNDLHHETNNGYNAMGELKPFPHFMCPYPFHVPLKDDDHLNHDSCHINYGNGIMPIQARPAMNLPFDNSMESNVALNQCPLVNREECFKFPTMDEGESFISQLDFMYPGDMGSILPGNEL
ncbi:NAC (No Apical Meristem) domain transcriptional regulator superfamily protein [Actinidia rufa]|uniref:NAC (No Apical Meristem) domain transcriptional regulator superfamily protein n=1 Tax=Actinidia rufa TaxID=165716 RepID=A0A7J0DIS9_9ERIC|nr:NAC (No Apical Meristem) domain transcriptional regulator superfamily protein [Actinidia rufa]